MNSLQLISTKKQLYTFVFLLSFIFLFNVLYEYSNYIDLKKEEIYSSKFRIVNIYDKEDYYVIKLQNDAFFFFTSISKENQFEKLDFIDVSFITTSISFYDFLKGFYAKSIYFENYMVSNDLKKYLFNKINANHEDIRVSELFNALFLAIPISKENRQIYTDLSISHLIAISGFHLAILIFIVYSIVYLAYCYLHKKYFIFRNKRFDILLLTIVITFLYLLLTGIVPSLLRAFIMFVIGIFLLRSNIKILSFNTLLLTLLLIVSIYPKFLFSISLWFSIIGVFYIFLYLQYFKNLPKVLSFFFFNIWIFLVFNPIVHYFFENTSYEQLISPFITILFTIFYPLELFFHLIGQGSLLDSFIIEFLNYKIVSFTSKTPLWLFIVYTITSLVSIYKKEAFIFLNILMLGFNLFMYLKL